MSLINLFVAARAAIASWGQRHRAYGELMALDDRCLADIGIHRTQIPGIIEEFYGAARRAPGRDAAFDAAPSRGQPWLAEGHR